MREALDALEAQVDPLSTAMVSDFLAMTYARLGEFAAAEETLARATRLAGGGDAISRVDVLIAGSAIHLERGELDKASEQSQECAMRAEELGAYACVVASNVMYGAATLALEDAPSAKGPLESAQLGGIATMYEFSRFLFPSLDVAGEPPQRMLGEGLYAWSDPERGDLLAARYAELLRHLAGVRPALRVGSSPLGGEETR